MIPTCVGAAYNGFTNVEIQATVGQMVPMNYLRLARISLFARVVRDTSVSMLTLLWATRDSPRSWLKAVREDLEFIGACTAAFRSMASASFQEWVAFFSGNGKRAVISIKMALAESGCNVISAPLPGHVAHDELYECPCCGDLWPTRQQVAVHMAVAHKRNHGIRRLIPYPTTRCSICLLEKHTRQELVGH